MCGGHFRAPPSLGGHFRGLVSSSEFSYAEPSSGETRETECSCVGQIANIQIRVFIRLTLSIYMTTHVCRNPNVSNRVFKSNPTSTAGKSRLPPQRQPEPRKMPLGVKILPMKIHFSPLVTQTTVHELKAGAVPVASLERSSGLPGCENRLVTTSTRVPANVIHRARRHHTSNATGNSVESRRRRAL